MSPLQTLHHFLKNALQNDSQLNLLGEDLELRPDSSGLKDQYPAQVHVLPASDTSLIGVAVGMATAGQSVIVQAATASSLPQILAAIPAFGPDFPLSLVIRVPVAPTEVLALDTLLAYPHIQVRCAHDSHTSVSALEAALSERKPCIVLESLSPQQLFEAPSNTAHTEIWAWGAGLQAAYDTAETLSAEGLICRVQALTQLQPIDPAVAQALFDTGRVVLVNLPTALLSTIHQVAFWRLEHPPVFCQADSAAIEAAVRTVLTP